MVIPHFLVDPCQFCFRAFQSTQRIGCLLLIRSTKLFFGPTLATPAHCHLPDLFRAFGDIVQRGVLVDGTTVEGICPVSRERFVIVDGQAVLGEVSIYNSTPWSWESLRYPHEIYRENGRSWWQVSALWWKACSACYTLSHLVGI